jgi:hypothetical protein
MATKSNASVTNAAVSSADIESAETANVAPRPSGIAPAGAHKVAPPLPHRPFDFGECHALTAPQRAAILPAAVLGPNSLDVPYASKVAIGTAARLQPYRDHIAARFSEELAEVDMLDTYARAATHSDVILAITAAPPEKVQAVYEAALEARRFLHSDISNLITLGLLAPKIIADVSNEPGHINTATDIQKLVAIADTSAESVRARLGITAEERSEYRRLAYELTELTSRRDSGKLTIEEARDDLARATTLLVKAYDIAERVMTYVLWENQAFREVVPSLYNNKPKARKGNGAQEPAPTTPVAAASVNPAFSVNTVDTADEEPVVPGARGGSPFAKKE